MRQAEGVDDDGAERCAVGVWTSTAAWRTCTELPRRAPRPLGIYHGRAQPVPAGSYPLQPTSTADACSPEWIWAAAMVMSDLLTVDFAYARWMPADTQWLRKRTLMHAYEPSAVRSKAHLQLDALHASDPTI